jgi:hypothetical protein
MSRVRFEPSVRTGEDCSCLRPHGHCDQLHIYITCSNITSKTKKSMHVPGIFLGVKGSWCIKLTSLPSVCRLSRKCGSLEVSHLTTLWASMTCYRDSFTFLFLPFIIYTKVYKVSYNLMFIKIYIILSLLTKQ